MIRIGLCAAVVMMSAGCAAAALTTNKASYAPGETATVTLENRGTQSIGYNFCVDLRLEQQIDAEWKQVVDGADGVCTMQLDVVGAFAERSTQQALPANARGTYRFTLRAEVPVGGGSQVVTSEPFVVEAN